jgi:hypothetical protein
MKITLAVVLLTICYLGLALALSEYFWISKCIPPILTIVIAWLIYPKISNLAIVLTLFILAILFPILLLVFGLDATGSISGNIASLANRLTLLEVVGIVTPIFVGVGTATVLRRINSLS